MQCPLVCFVNSMQLSSAPSNAHFRQKICKRADSSVCSFMKKKHRNQLYCKNFAFWTGIFSRLWSKTTLKLNVWENQDKSRHTRVRGRRRRSLAQSLLYSTKIVFFPNPFLRVWREIFTLISRKKKVKKIFWLNPTSDQKGCQNSVNFSGDVSGFVSSTW